MAAPFATNAVAAEGLQAPPPALPGGGDDGAPLPGGPRRMRRALLAPGGAPSGAALNPAIASISLTNDELVAAVGSALPTVGAALGGSSPEFMEVCLRVSLALFSGLLLDGLLCSGPVFCPLCG